MVFDYLVDFVRCASLCSHVLFVSLWFHIIPLSFCCVVVSCFVRICGFLCALVFFAVSVSSFVSLWYKCFLWCLIVRFFLCGVLLCGSGFLICFLWCTRFFSGV